MADQESGPQTAGDEPIIQDFLNYNARTPLQCLSAIQDAKPTDEAITTPVVVSDEELSALPQLIIRAGESGGVLTQTEFQITKFCAEDKLKKRMADGLLCMFRRDKFVPGDIRAETIRELEKIVTSRREKNI